MAPESSGLRILVAGDKSHAGKSTVSLGLLAAFLESGFQASELAYIKPATQCVSSTLMARFCQSAGIAYEHIGPVVFYRGFTREQLDIISAAPAESPSGATDESQEHQPSLPPDFAATCARAVDRVSHGKRLTLIDGVGYPSVGSIIGCSSADIAIACRAPVLIVGRPGVGDAIDAFNLCATYFEAHRIPVIGGIFNKCQPSGFYGRSRCAEYVAKFMAARRPQQRAYGLLPLHEGLGNLAAEETCSFAFKHPEQPEEAGPLTPEDEAAIGTVTKLFQDFVNTPQIVHDLQDATANPSKWVRSNPEPEPEP